jgi:hypothetical protein
MQQNDRIKNNAFLIFDCILYIIMLAALLPYMHFLLFQIVNN